MKTLRRVALLAALSVACAGTKSHRSGASSATVSFLWRATVEGGTPQPVLPDQLLMMWILKRALVTVEVEQTRCVHSARASRERASALTVPDKEEWLTRVDPGVSVQFPAQNSTSRSIFSPKSSQQPECIPTLQRYAVRGVAGKCRVLDHSSLWTNGQEASCGQAIATISTDVIQIHVLNFRML